ncbi:MAG: D-2-hydroxyacid dehydrogenase [Bacteroidia bacterium]|nr:D-2-hydroxyacid dehydrogenase [Bacteroidia bacterium]
MRILANDGIDKAGKVKLESQGFIVDTNRIEQADLPSKLHDYDVLLVRSATKVNKEILDAGSNLKLVGRAGVGLDNVDLVHAAEKNIKVINTPSASSTSVAELVFAHLFSVCRMLQVSNRIMPAEGNAKFNELKKLAANGTELKSKTLGILGFGRIGQEVARMAIGLGMNVVAFDPYLEKADIKLSIHPAISSDKYSFTINTVSKEEVLKQSDFITLHVPGGKEAVIGKNEIALMKDGSGIINCARGGVVNEQDLVEALKSGKLAYAGVDVFEKEPPVYEDILKLDNVSLSAHIGASTKEAQQRIGEEMSDLIISFFKS